MSHCCSDIEEDLANGSKRIVLWLVLIINLIMFFVEGIGGWLAQSNALMADALDMLGDAAIYGFSLFVIQRKPVWRTRAGILKGLIMSIFCPWHIGLYYKSGLLSNHPRCFHDVYYRRAGPSRKPDLCFFTSKIQK